MSFSFSAMSIQMTVPEAYAPDSALFDRMDTNRDGQISRQECKAGHKAMKKDR